ncbi:MAG: hypothetical protein KKE83_01330 [Proteobacteria bacterium]|nr:hypothetical protein [Pseudomonadota bacterium]MBU1546658.1 hypothetical protein [Pseudomonadota bacterium]MBU2618306.1 hypothetical protein [Pseudomonadota bacterium]
MTQENIFSLLGRSGPFATGDRPPSLVPFSPEARIFAKGLAEAGMRTRYRILRNQIFEFLDVRTFAGIQAIINDPARRKLANERAYRLLGNMFGIEGSAREVILRVNTYSRTADGVINYLKGKVLANYASYIEMTNEIDSCKSPVDLMLILFDDRYHKKARFEAKRKLILMNLAASIDQRERETEVEGKFGQFLDFLNEHVWSKKTRIGELEIVYLLSDHDPETFACAKVEVVSREQARGVERKANQKLTLIKRRRFQANGTEVPIYVSIRKKQSEAKVLKLLRKGEENPAVAVDDELGLMGVVDSVAEVKAFQKHLTQSATRAGSLMTLEEVSDTLSGGHHSGSVGSSAKTQMFKFFARMGGMRVEFIVHTNRSYLNYIYEREVSHDEYEVKRIFDSGVAQLLFPQDIYEIDIAEKKEAVLRWFRKRIEEF